MHRIGFDLMPINKRARINNINTDIDIYILSLKAVEELTRRNIT